MVGLATSWKWLQDLATRTRGGVIPSQELNRLADRPVSQVMTRERREDDKQ
jgi:hypothetical protein